MSVLRLLKILALEEILWKMLSSVKGENFLLRNKLSSPHSFPVHYIVYFVLYCILQVVYFVLYGMPFNCSANYISELRAFDVVVIYFFGFFQNISKTILSTS